MRSMENTSRQRKEDQKFELPPGFRFHPTDEELISHYLTKKVVDSCFIAMAIAEVDFNKCEPWDLPGLAKTGETEWYYFCLRHRKNPTGLRTNRATDAGYWKATGKDKEIITIENALIGMRKTLVFYKGRAPNGEKTNWVLHEYRLEAKAKHAEYNNLPKPEKSEWVICKVFKKSPCGNKIHIPTFGRFNSFREDQETHDNIETPSLDFSSSLDKANPAFSNQCTMMTHQIGKSQSQCSNYFLPEEHSMFRSRKQNENEEFSLGRDFDADSDISSLVYNNNNDMFQRWFGNQEHSSASSGDLDIDCLWNQITD